MKSLVVFYSFTGKTRLVAKTIAEVLRADLVEIEEVKPRGKGLLTYFTGGYGALMNRGCKIKPLNVDLRQYETIFIGSPVWASRPAPAINAFIYASSFDGQNIVPFYTAGGDNANKALANITAKIERRRGKVTGSFAIKSYKVTEDDMITSAKEAIKNFIK